MVAAAREAHVARLARSARFQPHFSLYVVFHPIPRGSPAIMSDHHAKMGQVERGGAGRAGGGRVLLHQRHVAVFEHRTDLRHLLRHLLAPIRQIVVWVKRVAHKDLFRGTGRHAWWRLPHARGKCCSCRNRIHRRNT